MPPKSKRRKHAHDTTADAMPQSVRLTRAQRMAQDPLRNNRADSKRGGDRYQAGKSGGNRSLFPTNRHYIYGMHPVVACLLNPARQNDVLFATQDSADRLNEILSAHGKSLNDCLNDVMIADKHALNDSVTDGAVHQGVILLTNPLPRLSLDQLLMEWERAESTQGDTAQKNRSVAVLDQITDPHNVGAIVRSACAFGVSAVILPDRHAPDESAVLAKSASGALEHVPLVSAVNLNQALNTLKQSGFWTVGFAGETDENLHDMNLTGKIALIMGAEGTGMRRLTRENCDFTCKIPMIGTKIGTQNTTTVDSLNVSNAAAIAFYEWSKSSG